MAQSNFELRRKLLQLEALHDLVRALNLRQPESDLLEELMNRAMAVLDATAGFACTLDEQLAVHQIHSFGLDAATAATIMEEKPLQEALSTRKPVAGKIAELAGKPIGDVLVAPMLAGESILGMLAVGGKEQRGAQPGSFIEDDLRFLESLASIGAAAIDNARRFLKLDLMRETLEDENRSLRARMLRDYNDRLMVGDSPKMQRVIDLVARVADSQANILIRGESGTGKEMVARLIHGNSPRKDGPFVAINCAALPETLLESELFGIERGVATGVEARPGKFELARGGTVFLDEIGDIPLTLQAKLLRVLQEREVEKLGGRRRIPIDVRFLAATHRPLEEMIERAEFRQDLYYRLKVVEITLPPLRERREDIPKLVRFFLDKYAHREGLQDVRISQEALQKIMRYPFPGNVRELENLIEGALALTVDPVVDPGDLLLPDQQSANPAPSSGELLTLEEFDARYIAHVLAHTGGNVSQAAKILGVDRKTLYRRRGSSHNATDAPKWDIH